MIECNCNKQNCKRCFNTGYYPSKQIGVGDFRFGDLEKKHINDVIESNQLSYGEKTQLFETNFAKEHQCDYGIFCNSGTSALQVSLAVLKAYYGWSDGDEVIVPSVTFVATVNIVLQNNLKPIFVDVLPSKYVISPARIKRVITAKTRAIIPVHLCGLPADMFRIQQIAGNYDLKIIEDSCETMFANVDGKSVGSWSSFGCFSTYMAHFLVTGVGGMITTNDKELALLVRSLINHGRDISYLKTSDDIGKTEKELNEIIKNRFKFDRIGYSYRATELEAAIGLGQLEQKDFIINKRRVNADYLIKQFKVLGLDNQLQLPAICYDRDNNFMMFPLVCLQETDRNSLLQYLEKYKIETRDLLPLVNQTIYKDILNRDDFPVADWLERKAFYISCHQYLTERELDYIVACFNNYFKV